MINLYLLLGYYHLPTKCEELFSINNNRHFLNFQYYFGIWKTPLHFDQSWSVYLAAQHSGWHLLYCGLVIRAMSFRLPLTYPSVPNSTFPSYAPATTSWIKYVLAFDKDERPADTYDCVRPLTQVIEDSAVNMSHVRSRGAPDPIFRIRPDPDRHRIRIRV